MCIAEDITSNPTTMETNSYIAMTCMDQLNPIAHYYAMNEEHKCRYQDLPERISAVVGLPVAYLSFGASRINVVPGYEYAANVAASKRKLAFN